MSFDRRQILNITGASFLAAVSAWWLARKHRAPTTDAPASQAALRAWIDTLVPAEPDFPGALALGVAERIDLAIQQQPAYAKLSAEALAWVDARALEAGGRRFADLAPEQRNHVVTAAAASAPGSAARTFFQATLDDTLFHTYADQRSWVGLGFAGPPQPLGFPDFAAAPRST